MLSAISSFFSSLYLFGAEYFAAWCVVGVLCVCAGAWIAHFWHKGSQPIAPPAPDVLQQLAQLSRDQEAIKRLLCLDDLTGLPNGRYLEQIALPGALAACAASRHPLTVAFLDFDHFGAYNKRHGHEAGNAHLLEGVRLILLKLSQGRCTDQLFRFYRAGDEFAILMPGADAVRADTTLTLVRSFLHAAGISVSIGAVVVAPGVALSARAVLGQADEAMRAVKRAGRGGPPNLITASRAIEDRASMAQHTRVIEHGPHA